MKHPFRSILILVLASLFYSGCLSSFRQAQHAFLENDMPTAISLSTIAIQQHPNHFEVHLLLIDALIEEDRLYEARDALHDAELRFPGEISLLERDFLLSQLQENAGWFAIAWIQLHASSESPQLSLENASLAIDGFCLVYRDLEALMLAKEDALAFLSAIIEVFEYEFWADEQVWAFTEIVDRELYPLIYQAKFDQARETLATFTNIFDSSSEMFLFRKHNWILSLESRTSSPDIAGLDELQLLALAFEVEAHGLYLSAVAFYRQALLLVPAERIATTWVDIARNELRAGYRNNGRESLLSVIEADPSVRVLQDALHVGETYDNQDTNNLLILWLENTACTVESPLEYAELSVRSLEPLYPQGDLSLIQSEIENAISQCEQACEQTCEALSTLITAHAFELFEHNQPELALEFAQRAQSENPTDEQTLHLILQSAVNEPRIAVDASRNYLAAHETIGTFDQPRSAISALLVFENQTEEQIILLYQEALESLILRHRESWQLTHRLAEVFESNGDSEARRRVMDQYISFSSDPDFARFQTAQWLVQKTSSNDSLIEEALEQLESLARDPDLVGVFHPNSQRDLPEAALRLAIELRISIDDIAGIRMNIMALAHHLGEDDPETWNSIWDLSGIRTSLNDETLLWLTAQALETGVVSIRLLELRAQALERLGRTREAFDTYVTLLSLDPERLADIVQGNSEAWLVLSLTNLYIERYGVDVGILTAKAELLAEVALSYEEGGERERILAHNAYIECLEVGCFLLNQLEQINELGFYDIASQVLETRIQAGVSGSRLLLDWSLARLGSGEAIDVVLPQIEESLRRLESARYHTLEQLKEMGFFGVAAQIVVMDLYPQHDENEDIVYDLESYFRTVLEASTLFIEAGEREETKQFVSQSILALAQRLLSSEPLPSGFSELVNREVFAGRLYNVAMHVLSEIGDYEGVIEIAELEIAAELHSDFEILQIESFRQIILAYLRKATRDASVLEIEDLSPIIGLFGGDQQMWQIAGSDAANLGFSELAIELLTHSKGLLSKLLYLFTR